MDTLVKGEDRVRKELDRVIKIIMREVQDSSQKYKLVNKVLEIVELLQDGEGSNTN